jgi:hypothetical protein
MITIVTYFRSQVVKFIFGGRNSGQNAEEKRGDAHFMKVAGRMGDVQPSRANFGGGGWNGRV